MDVVYPLGNGSLCKNQEIRYSLRSLKNIEYDKVYIIGAKPGFLKNIHHIHFVDTNRKQINVVKKLLYLCKNTPGLSDEFILMNDDFFFLIPQEIKNYCNIITLEALRDKTPRSNYGKSLNNTIEYLESNNLSKINFELHYPMIINKIKFAELFDKINLDREYNYRSIYGNYYGLGDKYKGVADYKIHDIDKFNPAKLNGFLSISDVLMVYDIFKNYIKTTFPEKSKYEL